MSHYRTLAITLCLLSAAATAHAALAVLYPPYLVGNSDGTAITHQRDDGPVSGFVVNVKTTGGTPIQNALVKLDFSDAISGANCGLYSTQPSGLTLSCAGHYVERYTDANGNATFTPRFGGQSAQSWPNNRVRLWVGAGNDQAEIWIPAISTDMDRDGKTGLSDYSLYTSAYNTPGYYFDADFDHDGVTYSDLGDFAIFSAAFGSGTYSFCP